MKIALLTEFFVQSSDAEITGGVESRFYYLAKELAKRHEVTVITSYRGGKKRDQFDGFKVIRVGPKYAYTHSGQLLKRISFAHHVYKELKRTRYDVVDSGCFFCYLPAILGAKKKLLTYHEVWLGHWVKNTGSYIGILGEIFERVTLLMGRKTPIVAVSRFTAKRLGRKDTIIVPNGIHINRSKSKTKKFTACYTGRLTQNKRVSDVIYACRKTNTPLIIIGGGPLSLKLKAKKNRKVIFTGHIRSHNDVLKKISECHIFCTGSVVEGFGISLLEAMGHGLPYAAYAIKPFIEITEGKGGFLVKPKDKNALAEAIEKLKDKKTYESKRKEALMIAKNYEWSKIAKKMEKVYESIIRK